MERLSDFQEFSLLAHLLEEEAQGNLDSAVVGKVRELGGINIVGRGVDLTVLIKEISKVLEECNGELEVLEKIDTCTNGETILKLVLSLLESLFRILADILCKILVDDITDKRLSKNERTECYKVKAPLDSEIQLCDTALEVEFIYGSLCTFVYDGAKVCALDLIGEFGLNCKAQRQGKLEGYTQMIVTHSVEIGENVLLVDGGSTGTDTGHNTNLCIGHHDGSHCNCDESE